MAKSLTDDRFATKNTSGKSSGKPEVESSGKNNLPLTNEWIEELDLDDLEFNDEIDEVPASWRLEKNSNGFYRWRWQKKSPDGSPDTYVNSKGNLSYRRGSKYVPIEEAKKRLE